jgi:hypothetical protein
MRVNFKASVCFLISNHSDASNHLMAIPGLIKDTSWEREVYLCYQEILNIVYIRMIKKSRTMVSSLGEDFHTALQVLDRQQQFYRPVVFLYGTKSSKSSRTNFLKAEKLNMDGIVEVLALVKVGGENETAATSSIPWSNIVPLCVSGSGNGSFTGTSKLKIGVLDDILLKRVCFYYLLMSKGDVHGARLQNRKARHNALL